MVMEFLMRVLKDWIKRKFDEIFFIFRMENNIFVSILSCSSKFRIVLWNANFFPFYKFIQLLAIFQPSICSSSLGGAAFLLKSLQLLLKLKHKRESENVLQFSCTENFSWNILRILTWTAAFCKKNEQKNGYMKKKKKKKNRQPSRHVEHRCSNSDPNEKKNVIKINLKMENF